MRELENYDLQCVCSLSTKIFELPLWWKLLNHKEIDLQDVWTDFESGASFRKVAGKYGINHSTLASRLCRADKKRYKEMMRRRRRRSTWFMVVTSRWKKRIKVTLIPRIWSDLETSSATLRQIARKYEIKYTSLTRWLQLLDRRRYLRIESGSA
jgi:transposase-like protein